MNIKETLVYCKQCYGRSMGYFGYVTQFLIITANIKLFEASITSIAGLTITQALLIAAPIFLFGNLLIGHLDLKHGIWKEENNFSWKVTPMANDLCDRAKRIENKLNEK
jgi:hypothetical protein